jgi:hypothetical protein
VTSRQRPNRAPRGARREPAGPDRSGESATGLAAQLAAQLTALEDRLFWDLAAVLAVAVDIERAAYRLEQPELVQRAAGRSMTVSSTETPSFLTWSTIYSTTTGDGGVDDLTGADRLRQVCADVRYRPRHPVRLLAVGVRDLCNVMQAPAAHSATG